MKQFTNITMYINCFKLFFGVSAIADKMWSQYFNVYHIPTWVFLGKSATYHFLHILLYFNWFLSDFCIGLIWMIFQCLNRAFFMPKKLQNNFSINLNLNFHLKPFTWRFVRSLSTGLCFSWSNDDLAFFLLATFQVIFEFGQLVLGFIVEETFPYFLYNHGNF